MARPELLLPKNLPHGAARVLFAGKGLDFQSTADQLLRKLFTGSAWYPLAIVARRRSGGASVACAGGVYTAAAKGGVALVAAAQSWVTLASGVSVTATLDALAATTDLTVSSLYLSLTTGSTAACLGDVFVIGVVLG